METVAHKLSGAAGPSGVDAADFKHILLRFGRESQILREELAKLTNWLANDQHPPYTAYRALMANRLVALDKNPGVRPVGIGEITRRLMAKCVIAVTGEECTLACGNFNLCAGLSAGIEGACHVMHDFWDGQVEDPIDDIRDLGRATSLQPEEERAESSRTDPADSDASSTMDTGLSTQADKEDDRKPPAKKELDPKGALQLNADDGFNEGARKAIMWTIRHLWPSGSRFSFNCYRHSPILIIRRPGKGAYFILSDEGVTQGDLLAMLLFGALLVPMAKAVHIAFPQLLQTWYADDGALAGSTRSFPDAVHLIQKIGPKRGYNLNLSKCVVTCRPKHQERAQAVLSEFGFQYRDGARFLRGFIGCGVARKEWLAPQIEHWTRSVEKLAKVSKRYPQAAYAGLTKSLQAEWTYRQRVLRDSGPEFHPVEAALSKVFIPALLGHDNPPVDMIRELMALPVKGGGIGIPNPFRNAKAQFTASRAMTVERTASLTHHMELDVKAHQQGRSLCQGCVPTVSLAYALVIKAHSV